MTDREIIQKIQLLRGIKPNEDWAVLAQKNILSKIERETARPGILNVFALAFRPGSLAVGLTITVFVGIFAFGFLTDTGREYVNKFPIPPSPFGSDTELVDSGATDKSDRSNMSDRSDKSEGAEFSIRTLSVGEENNEEFMAELFALVQEKLAKVEEMVKDVDSVSEAEKVKDLLVRAKSALDENNLVDAFDILVALERLLAE